MPEVRFRDARQSDIPVIAELCHAGATDPDRYPPLDAADPAYRELFAAIDADTNHRLIVGEIEGLVVATLQISYLPGLPERGWRGQLENIHVRADRRGRGIGSTMIAWAVERCRERGCWIVQLTSNKARTDAHRFYGALGFSPTHEGFKLKLDT